MDVLQINRLNVGMVNVKPVQQIVLRQMAVLHLNLIVAVMVIVLQLLQTVL